MSAKDSIAINRCVDCGRRIGGKPMRCRSCSHTHAVCTASLARILKQLPLGTKKGRWTVIGEPVFRCCRNGKKRRWLVPVRCECGIQKEVLCQNLLKGGSLSCSCYQDEVRRKGKHGGSRSKLYSLWATMRSRCYYPKRKHFASYGGRGIRVCESWRESFVPFRDWAITNGWDPELELDRIDNNGPYCPENCRFITHKAQNRNKRTNRILEAFGERKCLIEWTEDPRCVVGKGTVAARVRYGWGLEQALTTPAMSRQQCGRTRRKRGLKAG